MKRRPAGFTLLELPFLGTQVRHGRELFAIETFYLVFA